MLGESITINGTAFTVVGSVGKISRGNNDYDDQKVYIPVTTMQELYPLKGENIPQDALTSIQYQPAIKGDSTAAVAAVHRVIAERHGFDPSLKDAFDEFDTVLEEKMVGAIFDAMDLFLGGVGIVTLGLGAVGIINIMLVSVTERTHEIGLLKAIGATKRSILEQFFWEGLLLTGISGLIGIVIAGGCMAVLQISSRTRCRGLIRRGWCRGRPHWHWARWRFAAWPRGSIRPARRRRWIPLRRCGRSNESAGQWAAG